MSVAERIQSYTEDVKQAYDRLMDAASDLETEIDYLEGEVDDLADTESLTDKISALETDIERLKDENKELLDDLNEAQRRNLWLAVIRPNNVLTKRIEVLPADCETAVGLIKAYGLLPEDASAGDVFKMTSEGAEPSAYLAYFEL